MTLPNPQADSVAQDQIRSYVDRILRLRAEQRAIKGDEKEVYAEAKGNGFDKTVLGKIVLHVERLSDAKSAAEMQEQDALFDLYLEAYFGKRPSHTHAYAREDVPPHDAETGEIIEPETPVTHAPVQPGREEPGTTDGAASAGGTANDFPPGAAPASGEAGEANQARNLIPPASPANQSDRTKPNPWCADPDDCGVEASWNHMCGSCLRRRDAQRSAVEAMH